MSQLNVNPDVSTHNHCDPVRVVVIDDSAVVRGLVSRWIDGEPDLVTVGKFSNGQQAVDGVEGVAPDVIVLDIEMPVMDGVTALPMLLEKLPDAKVIIATTLSPRNAEISLKALTLGAVDYIPKPAGNAGITTSETFRKDLLARIKAVGLAKTGHPQMQPDVRGIRPPVNREAASGAFALRPFSRVTPKVLAIGSSTGGPKALVSLIREIAPIIGSIPVLITQHMPATFTNLLAANIRRDTGCNAKEAEDGELLQTGTVYIAPGSRHMALGLSGSNVVLRVYDGAEVNFCKPAVDPLFQSVAKLFGASALAVVLTGMGHDGADGAARIADAGGSVIAQDRATSVVWGMPGAAAGAGACAAILPIGEIGRKVTALLNGAAE